MRYDTALIHKDISRGMLSIPQLCTTLDTYIQTRQDTDQSQTDKKMDNRHQTHRHGRQPATCPRQTRCHNYYLPGNRSYQKQHKQRTSSISIHGKRITTALFEKTGMKPPGKINQRRDDDNISKQILVKVPRGKNAPGYLVAKASPKVEAPVEQRHTSKPSIVVLF